MSLRNIISGRAACFNNGSSSITSVSYTHLIIGAGEPALPGISIGHNGTIAFGLTIFDVDQEDLYVYDVNPANAREYRYQGAWEPMRVLRETIPVKGAAPVSTELVFTRHGPVIYADAAKHRAYACLLYTSRCV